MTTAERIAQLKQKSAQAKKERDSLSRDDPRWIEVQYVVLQASEEITRIIKEQGR